MKKKILKLLFACFAFVFIFSLTVLPTFAYDSVNGWYDFSPNMPDLNLFYKREGGNVNAFPRTLTGYIAYDGDTISRQSQNGNTLSTFKGTDTLGYRFTTFYAVEMYWDFIYLPISSVATEDSFSLDLELAFTTNDNDSSTDNDVHLRVGYFTDGSIISVKTFTYSFEHNDIRQLNIYNILNDSDASALAFIQLGYDFSSEAYANQKYLDGDLTISNLADWIRLNPFLNATSNLLTSAYNNGYSDAMEQLGGADAEEFYRAGFTNGYNSGYSDGYSVGVNDSTLNTTAYSNGYQVGYAEGYRDYANSVDSQLTSKYNEGYADGLRANENNGYNNGYDAGYNEGYSLGESTGYDTGYYDGIAESLEDVGLFDYAISSISAFFNMPLGEHFTLGGVLAIVLSVPILILILKLFNGG